MSDFDPQNPPTGWIHPDERTQEQQDAHETALAIMPKFAAPPGGEPAGPVKIMLTDFWKRPECVADMGIEFTGFGQYTGSCVGVSNGDAVCTVSCVQRCIGDEPTKAMIPWWPFDYGRCRFNEGDRGQGEGAVDSVMGKTIQRDGVFEYQQGGFTFDKAGPDGLWLSKRLELQWSDGSKIDPKYLTLARQFPVGGVITTTNSNDAKLSIVNGCPILWGLGGFVGKGAVKGEGQNAYVRGKFDTVGSRYGHSTCLLGYWDHPSDGPLFLYSNQWPTSTYPKDPAGGGRCTVWIPASEVDLAFSRYGAGKGEAMALSHLTYVPAQADKLMSFLGM